jgi:hypothetical protein
MTKREQPSIEELRRVMLVARRDFARTAPPVTCPKDMSELRLGTLYPPEYAGSTAE